MRLPPCSTLSPYTTLFRSALVEELGDLLLQVLFHARVGTEGSIGAPFDVDDVATGLIAKLVRRHPQDRKSTRLNSSHVAISYAVFCLQKKNNNYTITAYTP